MLNKRLLYKNTRAGWCNGTFIFLLGIWVFKTVEPKSGLVEGAGKPDQRIRSCASFWTGK